MKKYNNSNKKPKKNSGKNTSSAKAKSKNKTKANTPKVYTLEDNTEQLSPSNYNGGAVISFENNDTTTASNATTYYAEVDAAKKEEAYIEEPVITALPNKEELYSKYTEVEEETSTHPNNLLPKANTDGVNTMIIVAGALALIAFLALVLS
jgi:hypothetical protein